MSWQPVEVLPSELDVSKAEVFRQKPDTGSGRVLVGGRWYVWRDPDEVWWQMPAPAPSREVKTGDERDAGEKAGNDGSAEATQQHPVLRWKRSHLTPDAFNDESMWLPDTAP
ncbi:hypothetical protein ADL03_06905 [Nocardia sp. NRRL S-836]|nr:hypothetical protein ADL03_06905 [Nocardia sp. NRRL S-836]